MLVIAIPKSASTSLMITLGRVHGIPAEQRQFHDLPASEAFPVLGRWHADSRELDPPTAASLTAPEGFAKQHIIPTPNNRELLRGRTKVVLLRSPDEVVLAYRRANLSAVNRPRAEFEGIGDEAGWLQRAEDIGLLDELWRFWAGWLDEPDCLYVGTAELVTTPDRVLRRISRHFDLPAPGGDLALSRELYTGSPWRNNLRRLRRRIGVGRIRHVLRSSARGPA